MNLAKNPIMSLGKKGCFDEFGNYPTSVIRMGDETWRDHAGWTRAVPVPFNVGIGLAKSTDNGETFERLGDGPILPHTPTSRLRSAVQKLGKLATDHLFYVAGNAWLKIEGRPEISHRIRVAVSDDGLSWARHNADIIPNFWDDHESQASPDVFYANGKYHMFFCGWVPKNFRDTRNRWIGYASSDDLLHWVRDDSKAGITVSAEEDAFDNEMVAYPHVFELDGTTYMLYLGNSVGQYGLGLAELGRCRRSGKNRTNIRSANLRLVVITSVMRNDDNRWLEGSRAYIFLDSDQ